MKLDVTKMTDYLDNDFALRGRQKPIKQKSKGESNSQLTMTTEGLSQNTLYSTDNYRDLSKALEDVLKNGETAELSKPTETVNGYDQTQAAIKSSLKGKKDLVNRTNLVNYSPPGDSTKMVNGITNDFEMTAQNGLDADSNSVRGAPKSPDESQWFTRPAHLERAYSALRSPSPSAGGFISARTTNSSYSPTKDLHHTSPTASNLKELARDFFPLTLGPAYSLRASTLDPTPVSKSLTFSPSPKGLKRPSSVPWKPKRSKSPSRRRHSSGHSNSTSSSTRKLQSSAPVQKMYLLTSEAPVTGSSTVLLSSPYEHELARLRMERLRIEESHLLEVKRQEELERIRGPKPKWYELKTPNFHYEAHKNTQLLENKGKWQDLLDYRNELVRASKEFQQSYSPEGFDH